MKTVVCVVLEIEHDGEGADAFDAVGSVLDDGIFQDAINATGDGVTFEVTSAVTSLMPEPQTLRESERAHIARVVAACGFNKSLAARTLGIDRRTLYRKLAQAADAAGAS